VLLLVVVVVVEKVESGVCWELLVLVLVVVVGCELVDGIFCLDDVESCSLVRTDLALCCTFLAAR
jgi:hypothetical protein